MKIIISREIDLSDDVFHPGYNSWSKQNGYYYYKCNDGTLFAVTKEELIQKIIRYYEENEFVVSIK